MSEFDELLQRLNDLLIKQDKDIQEARNYARRSFKLIQAFPTDNNLLLGLPEDHDFPDWIYE